MRKQTDQFRGERLAGTALRITNEQNENDERRADRLPSRVTPRLPGLHSPLEGSHDTLRSMRLVFPSDAQAAAATISGSADHPGESPDRARRDLVG
jgi:hypothetical protein